MTHSTQSAQFLQRQDVCYIYVIINHESNALPESHCGDK